MRQFLEKAARSRRGSVSLEFALVSVFILLPLFAGGADFVLVMAAQAQLRTAIQALDYFAWTNPDEANNMTDAGYIISLINQRSDYQITLPATLSTGGANGALSYSCFTPPATAGTTVSPPSPTTCPSTQTQQTLVTYQVTARVFLPVPLPGILSSPEKLSVTSTIQVQ
jgi:Flp pilus assembly protein TadG